MKHPTPSGYYPITRSPDVSVFRLSSILIELSGDDLYSRLNAAVFLQRFFHVTPTTDSATPCGVTNLIKMVFHDANAIVSIPAFKSEFPSKTTLRVWDTTNGFFISYRDSWLNLDLNMLQMEGKLSKSFWDSCVSDKRSFFQVFLFLVFWWKYGVYLLHSNGIFNPSYGSDKAVLLVGSSGAGKTTLTLSLFRRGWSYVGDDTILISKDAMGQVNGHTFRRGLAYDSQVLASWSELAIPLHQGVALNRNKMWFDLESIYPSRCKLICKPSFLFFPIITNQVHSRVKRLDTVQTFTKILNHTDPSVLREKSSAQSITELCRSLTLQTRGFQAELGLDVLCQPEYIASLLEKALSNG